MYSRDDQIIIVYCGGDVVVVGCDGGAISDPVLFESAIVAKKVKKNLIVWSGMLTLDKPTDSLAAIFHTGDDYTLYLWDKKVAWVPSVMLTKPSATAVLVSCCEQPTTQSFLTLCKRV